MKPFPNLTLFHLDLEHNSNIGPVLAEINKISQNLPGESSITTENVFKNEYVFILKSEVFLTNREYHQLFDSLATLPGVIVLFSSKSGLRHLSLGQLHTRYLGATKNVSVLQYLFGHTRRLARELNQLAKRNSKDGLNIEIQTYYGRFFVLAYSSRKKDLEVTDSLENLLSSQGAVVTASYKSDQ